MAGEEAIVIHVIEKKIVRKFQDQCATDPKQAISLESLGHRHRRIIQHLIRRKILVAADQDRYYLDEEAAELHFARKRRLAFIMLILVLIIFLSVTFLVK
jgi:hypothetical protein